MRFTVLLLSSLFLTTNTLAAEFTVTTNAFLDTGALPVLYTCDGKDESPDLSWSNPPANTQSFAVIMSDADAPNGPFYHWVLYNLPTKTTTLEQGLVKLPAGAAIGKNSWNKLSYNGPCPAKGSTHTYTISLYALDSKLALSAGADAATVLNQLKGHTIKKLDLTAVYSRWLV